MPFTIDADDRFERGLRGKAAELRRIAATTKALLTRGVVNIGEAAARRVSELTPRSDGPGPHLADGWRAKVDDGENGITVRVTNEDPRANDPIELADGTPAPYTLLQILEYGSRPHEIRPARGDYLVFFSRLLGRMVYAKSVQHPGTRAYSMVGITRVQASADMARLLDAARNLIRRGGA